MKVNALISILLLAALSLAGCQSSPERSASNAAQIDREVDVALKNLYASTPAARALEKQAKGVLIFPDVMKAGFVFGGQYGDGALRKGGRTAGYYRTVAASWGLQAGAQTFGYVLFFMNDAALTYLDKSEGWEIGVGPSIVVLDQGAAGAFTTTTAQHDIYAFFFDQKGLMAGLGLEGSKITRIQP